MKVIPKVYLNNSIRDSVVVINRFSKQIAFVLDQAKLVGVVTDGDVRRHIANGGNLDDKISLAMRKDFFALPVTSDLKTIRENFSKRIRYIPLVDESGCLVDVADPNGNFRIPGHEPSMIGNELKYVTQCIEENWISSQGKFVSEFEFQFENLHYNTNALSVSNGTVALHLALISLGIGPGDEVILPNLTFAASANAVIHAGASPVFCEIEPDTWCISAIDAKKLIGPKTKAIMSVHLYGQPCKMMEIQSLCEQYDLFLIEDCAEALGSKWNSRLVGTFGEVATFSFFGNKTISTGEGGMIIFKNSKTAEKAKILRDHGMSKDKRYWHEVTGYNYRMTNLQAAVGVAQMEKLDLILDKKRKILKEYTQKLNGVKGISRLPFLDKKITHSNWLFGIILEKSSTRDTLIKQLLGLGIETRSFFYPLHTMPPYRRFKRSTDLKICNELSCKGLLLPSSMNLSSFDIDFITKSIVDILKEYG